jgi:hypothetical protein
MQEMGSGQTRAQLKGRQAPSGPSLQDVINNAVAPLRIKREFIEAEGDTMDVEADANNIEVVGVVQPTFQQLGEGGRTTLWRTSGISTGRGWILLWTILFRSLTTPTTPSGGCA